MGHGSKGLREYRWAWTELTRLGNAPNQHALLVREAMTTNTRGEYDRAYYLVFAPARTTLAAVAQVAGARWTIEQGFEAAKQEVGLDEYEVRKYDGWYRDITLALFAHAFLTVVRAQATPGKKGLRARHPTRERSSRQPFLKSSICSRPSSSARCRHLRSCSTGPVGAVVIKRAQERPLPNASTPSTGGATVALVRRRAACGADRRIDATRALAI